MTRLTAARLRELTLRRQFPAIRGRGQDALVTLVDRVGPVQSQAPRAPFLMASARLPGITHADVTAAFAAHRLVKASSLRGTVHTTTARGHAGVEAVARCTRGAMLGRALGLERTTTEQVVGALETFCSARWRSRDDVVGYGRDWISRYDSPEIAARVADVVSESYLWGHSGLLRGTTSGSWHTRHDTLRRTAAEVLGSERMTPDEALAALVAQHLAAFGPAQRIDLEFFLAATPRQVREALRRLGDRVGELSGPGEQTYLDLAEPPRGGRSHPGLRLLPEFDGVLMGYARRNRTRFLAAEHEHRVWNAVNGTCKPMVLHEDRVRGTWTLVGPARRPRLEITVFPGEPRPSAEDCTSQVAAVGRVLDLEISELVLRES